MIGNRYLPVAKKLPISCNTYNWKTFFKRDGLQWGEDFDYCIREFSKTGIKAIEPAFSVADDVRRILPHLKKYGIQMPSAYCNSFLHDSDQAPQSIKDVLGIADALQEEGTKILVTNPNPIKWGEKIAKTDKQIIEQTKNLRFLGKELYARGILLAYHIHDMELLDGGKEFHHVLQNTNPEEVAFCLDAHWIYRGCGDSEIAVYDMMKLYSDRVAELHLRQSRGGVWTETFGEGDINYKLMADFFKKAGRKPHLVIEQAVEKGSSEDHDAVSAHQLSLKAVEKMFV